MWKSKLELASEVVESLVKQTNKKINELGQYDYDLYNALIRIQQQFDKIRNVPSDKQLQYQAIKKVSMEWKQQVDQIESDYGSIGGMAAGNALLALAGPMGWTIAGVAFVSSALLVWKAISDKERLVEIFMLISQRDQNSYKQAIVELNERIKRIIDETKKLNEAILNIKTFGLDYTKMTEQQQYTLGAYVNLMNASTQLLVNPINGIQPKYTLENLQKFVSYNTVYASHLSYKYHKELVVYMANLLYKIDVNESDRKLISKLFKGNKEFRKNMKLEKDDLGVDLFNLVDVALRFKYQRP